jgi:cytoskeletal protein RodZ
MLFKKNKIKDGEETVAEKLRLAREGKKISLEEAAKKLGINSAYLAALENSDFDGLPSGVYEKIYLKKYASLLGLNPARLEEKLKKEKGAANKSGKDVFAKKKINPRELLVFPKILKNIAIIIIVAALFLYLGFYLKNVFSQPQVIISSPPDNLVTENNFVEVSGQTSSKTQITINDKQILKDGEGNFRESVELKKGLNIVIISAQNKYSRKKIIEKQILVK